jgi:peptide/nickel transport system permease protein
MTRRLDPWMQAGLAIYLLFAVVALLADVIAPHDPAEILFTAKRRLAANLPPGSEHWLGTTRAGRDIFSQLVHGARSALFVGATAALSVLLIGTVTGVVAGYRGGRLDSLLMRIGDVALGIPFVPFVLLLSSLLGPSTGNVVLGIALLLWPTAARVIRAQVMVLRTRGYVEAAQLAGAGPVRIMAVHILPSVLPIAVLYGSVAVGWAILTEAAVSFLGFGGSGTISWGAMLQDAYTSQALSRGAWNWFLPPGLCIVLAVVAGFIIGRGAETRLFPNLMRR